MHHCFLGCGILDNEKLNNSLEKTMASLATATCTTGGLRYHFMTSIARPRKEAEAT